MLCGVFGSQLLKFYRSTPPNRRPAQQGSPWDNTHHSFYNHNQVTSVTLSLSLSLLMCLLSMYIEFSHLSQFCEHILWDMGKKTTNKQTNKPLFLARVSLSYETY